jgi:HAD superfamily hydrolase (TIGR01509 family)
MFDAVLFDLDGLLIDTERLIAEVEVELLSGMGYTGVEKLVHQLIGKDETECARIMVEAFEGLDLESYDKIRQTAVSERYNQGIPIKTGAVALLADLTRRNVPRAVATNSRTATGLRKLALTGLDKYMPELVGFDAVEHAKPAPDVFIEAARRVAADPAKCVAFEDSETGSRAAKAAGCFVVQIPDLGPATGENADVMAESLIAGAIKAGVLPEGFAENS